ncbi:Uncharacterised protein [Yersinia pseudotuberculosis]|nr:Uncharacterised protein [Yersinia pseudotuberculosis]CNB60733.1 Uncharacterised protein [Yersinia pseudotuberculosis]CNB86915.1 Uncharacterised protein [Yersinia pseudotuberculosis]CRY60671.1 Uncharacterised protein [Yersinia pseudotuberculosis]SUB31136.1 Uncharacterised protein [Yersinia pseudotuberculosis]
MNSNSARLWIKGRLVLLEQRLNVVADSGCTYGINDYQLPKTNPIQISMMNRCFGRLACSNRLIRQNSALQIWLTTRISRN